MSCPAVVQGKPNAINNLQWLARHRWYKASVVHYCVYYCESLKFWCCHTQLVSSCFYETCIFLCWRHGPKIKSNLQRQQMEVSRRKLGISLQQSLGWNSRKSHKTSIVFDFSPLCPLHNILFTCRNFTRTVWSIFDFQTCSETVELILTTVFSMCLVCHDILNCCKVSLHSGDEDQGDHQAADDPILPTSCCRVWHRNRCETENHYSRPSDYQRRCHVPKSIGLSWRGVGQPHE